MGIAVGTALPQAAVRIKTIVSVINLYRVGILFSFSFYLFSVSFQKVGEDGVFAGGGAARKHPAPQLTEMILFSIPCPYGS
jgi:hypothetical protein